MKAVAFALFLLVIAGCGSVAAAGPKAADDAELKKCISAIVSAIETGYVPPGFGYRTGCYAYASSP